MIGVYWKVFFEWVVFWGVVVGLCVVFMIMLFVFIDKLFGVYVGFYGLIVNLLICVLLVVVVKFCWIVL